MTLYCAQCGAVIEDGAGFCYQCGALSDKAFDMDDDGNLRASSGTATRICPKCGFSNPFNDTVCSSCGAAMPSIYEMRTPKKLDRRDYLAIILALVPGCLGLCGIGHLVYRRYSRALMYACISLLLLYVEISIGFGATSSKMMFFHILSLFVFFRSAMELIRMAYYPEEQSTGDKGDGKSD